MEWNSMNKLIKSLREGVQHQTEATMMKDTGEVVHNCAKHVEHATWGKGATISEEHAAPDAAGNIAWYDVMFEHGLERQVPAAELSILVSETHKHAVKKSVKEEEDLTDKVKMKNKIADDEDDDDEDMKNKNTKCEAKEMTAKEKKLAAMGHPKDKITHKDVLIGRGVLAKEEAERMQEDVDQTIEYKAMVLDIKEGADYADYFKAGLAALNVNDIAELSEEDRRNFFAVVDESFNNKDDVLFLEAWMSSDIKDKMKIHTDAGNKVSDHKSMMKAGSMEHSFVVTQPSGKRTRHIYHGNTRRLETMSPAPKSRDSQETGDDEDDK